MRREKQYVTHIQHFSNIINKLMNGHIFSMLPLSLSLSNSSIDSLVALAAHYAGRPYILYFVQFVKRVQLDVDANGQTMSDRTHSIQHTNTHPQWEAPVPKNKRERERSHCQLCAMCAIERSFILINVVRLACD